MSFIWCMTLLIPLIPFLGLNGRSDHLKYKYRFRRYVGICGVVCSVLCVLASLLPDDLDD
ncbi:MAG: hypothetical protein Q4G59_05100 [Planctomycetia bacterium]|nr:hypothetical protein [Planctomycetia bacterium]